MISAHHQQIHPSALHVYEHCELAPALAMLRPQGTAQPVDPIGALSRGRRFHSAVAATLSRSLPPPVEDDLREAWEAWLVDVHAPLSEQLAAHGPGGLSIAIEQPFSSDDGVSGTPDLLIIDNSSAQVEIWDWKTGDSSYVAPLEEHRQLHCYGWLVHLRYPGHRIAYHLYWPDSREQESWMPTQSEQRQLESEVIHLIERARRSTMASPPTLGEHCGGCGGRYACPAQLEALHRGVESYPELQLDGGIRTEEQALAIALTISRFKEAAERGRELVLRWIEQRGPITDPATGKQYAQVARGGAERLAQPAAVAQRLLMHGVQPAQIYEYCAVKRDEFKRLLESAGPPVVAESAWEELRSMGAVTSVPTMQLRWVRGKKET